MYILLILGPQTHPQKLLCLLGKRHSLAWGVYCQRAFRRPLLIPAQRRLCRLTRGYQTHQEQDMESPAQSGSSRKGYLLLMELT